MTQASVTLPEPPPAGRRLPVVNFAQPAGRALLTAAMSVALVAGDRNGDLDDHRPLGAELRPERGWVGLEEEVLRRPDGHRRPSRRPWTRPGAGRLSGWDTPAIPHRAGPGRPSSAWCVVVAFVRPGCLTTGRCRWRTGVEVVTARLDTGPVAVQSKLAPTANGPVQIVPVDPSGKVHVRPVTTPLLTTVSVTVTWVRVPVPVLLDRVDEPRRPQVSGAEGRPSRPGCRPRSPLSSPLTIDTPGPALKPKSRSGRSPVRGQVRRRGGPRRGVGGGVP